MRILIVDGAEKNLFPLHERLEKNGVVVESQYCTDLAAASAQCKKYDLAVFAETLQTVSGLDSIKIFVPENPFLHCALQSSLAPDKFHDVTEGYGILMQVPSVAPETCAESLVAAVQKISSIR